MTSYIILAKDKQTREMYALKKIHVDPLDSTFIEAKEAIGIEEIRNLQKKIFFKPLKGKNKVTVIKDAHNLTIEAQNALLKLLEEPPANTYIMLTAESKNNLLPTILSRCTIITLNETITFSDKEKSHYVNQLKELLSYGIAEKLKLAETIGKDKETALIWLEKMILATRDLMLKNVTETENSELPTYSTVVKRLQQTYIMAKTTNVHPRFSLEHLFLNL